jgi:hypothetical protein
MELLLFGKRVYLDLNFIAIATKIPHGDGAIFNSKENTKLEKNAMNNKICREMGHVPRNGVKMQDVPSRLYKTLIYIILGMIMNSHGHNISGDYTRLVIH